MGSMIESLESRTLFSGISSATLAGDNSLIISDAASVKGAVSALFAVDLANDQTIVTALKGVHTAGTSGVVRSIKADQLKAKSALTADLNSLTRTGLALAKKSVTAGNSLLLHSTHAKIGKVAVDASLLGKVTTRPLAKIAAVLGSAKILNDLEALRTLNSGNASISAAITVREQGNTQQAANVTAAGLKFQTDIDTLATHLVAIFTA